MIFTLIIRTNHLNNSYTALKFANALIQKQQTINFIYFITDSVYMANKNIDMPSDEYNIAMQWSDFAAANNLDLTVCAASGLRRGIDESILWSRFKMGSIGQLVESCEQADRVISL